VLNLNATVHLHCRQDHTLITGGWWEELLVAERHDHQSENSGGEHFLPVVPVVVHQRHPHHGREEQRHGDDAELGAVASPVERLDLAVQVPQQEAQPGKKP